MEVSRDELVALTTRKGDMSIRNGLIDETRLWFPDASVWS